MATRLGFVGAMTIILLAWIARAGFPQDQSNDAPTQNQEKSVEVEARGTFTVSLKPIADTEASPSFKLGRMSLEKKLEGDLVGTGSGEMLSFISEGKGSGGYVAIERLEGTLNGRKGSFVLQHSGTMTRGEPQLSITVVPDSGTDELAGIHGRFEIDLSGGKHAYTFKYALPQ